VIVAETRVTHAERSEDVLFREPRERLATHPLDEHRREEESRVAVQVLLARQKVEDLLSRDDLERIVVGREVGIVDASEVPER
jgi:hypothetical protein